MRQNRIKSITEYAVPFENSGLAELKYARSEVAAPGGEKKPRWRARGIPTFGYMANSTYYPYSTGVVVGWLVGGLVGGG